MWIGLDGISDENGTVFILIIVLLASSTILLFGSFWDDEVGDVGVVVGGCSVVVRVSSFVCIVPDIVSFIVVLTELFTKFSIILFKSLVCTATIAKINITNG